MEKFDRPREFLTRLSGGDARRLAMPVSLRYRGCEAFRRSKAGVCRAGSMCLTGGVDQLVRAVLDGAERRDWSLVRRVLHPYLHWTENETTTRGRTKVLALLADRDSVDPPVFVEVRDGQIYRWTTG